MAAAVSKLMRNQDLILVASKCRVVTRFRNTLGLPGRLSIRLQPNHPTDDPAGIGASILDGLLYGCGDAVIGINPATDSVETVIRLLRMLDELIAALRDSDAVVRAGPRDDAARRDRAGGAGRPGVSIDRRHRGGQRQLRRQSEAARRGAARGTVAAAAARSATT